MKQEVKELLLKYRKRFRLEDTIMNVVFADDKRLIVSPDGVSWEVDTEAEVSEKNPLDKRYTIVIHRIAAKNGLANTIKHELLHILLWEMTECLDGVLCMMDVPEETKKKMQLYCGGKEHETIDKLMKIIR